MLFDLKLSEFMILYGVLGKTNSIYWESRSAAKLLKYNINYFLVRYSTHTLKEIAPRFWIDKFIHVDQNIKVIENVKFLACLKKNKKKLNYCPLVYEWLQNFNFLVTVDVKEEYLPVVTKCLGSTENGIKFYDWLEVFRQEVMNISPPLSPPPALPWTSESSIPLVTSPSHVSTTESSIPFVTSPSHVSTTESSIPFASQPSPNPFYVSSTEPPHSSPAATLSQNVCHCNRPHEWTLPAASDQSPQQPSTSTASNFKETSRDRCSPDTFKRLKELMNSSNSFHFWLDEVPPKEVIVYCGNQVRTFVPKQQNSFDHA